MARAANWGSGKTYQECMNQGLTNYGPRTGQKWVGGFYKDLYDCTAPESHAVPSLDRPSEIPYDATTDVSLAVGSSDPFTQLEYYHLCYEYQSGSSSVRSHSHNSLTRPLSFGSTTSRNNSWRVTTGDGSGECFNVAGVRYYVRIKSATTEWSDWVYEHGSVTRQPDWGSGMTYQECMNQSLTNYGPRTGQRWIGSTYSDLYLCTGSTHGAPSLSSPPSIPDREVTDVTLTVSSSDAFTEVEHYYQCENSDADSVSSDIENSVVASTTGTSVTWQDVPAGAGDAECYRDEPVLYYVRVRSTNTPWSEWQSASGSITASTNPVHLAPSLESASHGSVPYGTATRFTAIATSTEAFDRIEYKSFCYQHSGGSVTSETGRVPPFSPAVLRRTVAWDVTTGDDDGECYSTSGIQFYVRVKSASTNWSNWVYIRRSVVDPTQHLPPSIGTPSRSEIPFGETTRFTAIVTSAEAFDELEYGYSCQQLDGDNVAPDAAPLGPFDPAVLRRTVAWSVTTGDDDDECYSNSGIQFYVRVKSDSTAWSDDIYESIPVTAPPTTSTQHLPPSINTPSLSEIPFGETTRFIATVTSTQVFDRIEYKSFCYQHSGGSVTSGTGRVPSFSPTVSSRIVAWNVTTGDDDGECYSNSGIQFYVRVKSDSTTWSNWVYIRRSVVDPTQHLPPLISGPSLLAIPFGETTRFTATAASAEAFDELEYRYSCQQQGGGDVAPDAEPLGPFDPAVLTQIVAWNVTTGDNNGECHGNSGIQFYVRVKSDSTAWSDDIYELIPVTAPPTTSTQHLPPSINTPSLSEIPFGETTRFTATVTSTQVFDRIEYKSFCQQHSGGGVTSETGHVEAARICGERGLRSLVKG